MDYDGIGIEHLTMGVPFGSVYRESLFDALAFEAQQIEDYEGYDRGLA